MCMQFCALNMRVCILTVFDPIACMPFTCKHLHACYCMCGACEQISSEWLYAYGLEMLVLYFVLLYS